MEDTQTKYSICEHEVSIQETADYVRVTAIMCVMEGEQNDENTDTRAGH